MTEERDALEDSQETDHQILQEDTIVDLLTGEARRSTAKEELLQRMIQILAAEYRFPLESMERDVSVQITVNGRKRRRVASLVIFEPEKPHELDHAQRIVVVEQPNTKPTNARRGVELLKDMLDGVEACEFGVWTNGRDISYLRKRRGPVQSAFDELSDFPGNGEKIEELNRPDRRIARVAVTEDLRDTVLRCHDYLYGNQSMTATRAFAEMVKLIFCKIYDEQQLRAESSYSRQFWVGVTERNSPDGQKAISWRINQLFERMKRDDRLGDVFRPADEIELEPRHLAWIAGELARYHFLDADIDVKGMAYEAMVATTMKRERGQFFTPRGVVDAMVEMLAPEPHERVLDPACGSGRFLVACLDRYRRIAADTQPGMSETERRRRLNDQRLLADAAAYAQRCLFGIDVDPELERAAKMNMMINNDGHGNLFAANSLEVTPLDIADRTVEGSEHLGFGSFDVVLTNPPFGSKIPIDDPDVLRGYDLAHQFRQLGFWRLAEARGLAAIEDASRNPLHRTMPALA